MSSNIIGKTLNKVAYGFSPRRFLDLYLIVPQPDTYVACIEAIDAIFFALTNQKKYYNRNYQLLFMKVGDWAMLKLYKDYSIPSSIGITKKLIQQYIGPFQFVEKIG